MIKAAGRTGMGDPLLILGLSGENVTRLTAGEPIHIPIADIDAIGLPPMDIVIHYGRTEQAILDEITGQGIELRTGGLVKRTEEHPRPWVIYEYDMSEFKHLLGIEDAADVLTVEFGGSQRRDVRVRMSTANCDIRPDLGDCQP